MNVDYKNKKWWFLGFSALMLLWLFFFSCGEAEANQSRVAAMGGDSRLFLDDNVTVYQYPGRLHEFPHVNVEDGNSATLLHDWGTSVAGFSLENTGGNWLQLLYGTDSYGLIVGTGLSSDGLENGTSSSEFNIRYGQALIGGDFGLGIDWGSASADSVETSAWELNSSYRGADSWGMFNVTPILGFAYSSDGPDNSAFYIDAGFGLNETLGENGRVVAGVFTSVSTETSVDELDETDSVSAYSLPRFTIGAEYDLFDWMTLRAGANRETVFADGAIEHNFGQSYGVGFSYDNVSFDGVLSDGLLRSGPNFISGNSNDLFTQFSLTYDF